MIKAKKEKTELVSPPCVAPRCGDNSPFMVSDPSPSTSTLERSNPSLIVSAASQVEAKSIADGFLSEVSTPDINSKNGQDSLSYSEDKKNDGCHATNVSPQKPLPAACKQPNETCSSAGDVSEERLSNYKTEEVLINSGCSLEVPQAEHSTNGMHDEEQDSSENDECTGIDDFRQLNVQQDTASDPKRKHSQVNEDKLSRKRPKTGVLEKPRGKGSTQWSHLSEEELKKLRRVKNRESVEKCRAKQRLRMEALQVEQTCLRVENKSLREAVSMIREAIHDVSRQVSKIKVRLQSQTNESNLEKMQELQKELPV